jgi:hypothetical protein
MAAHLRRLVLQQAKRRTASMSRTAEYKEEAKHGGNRDCIAIRSSDMEFDRERAGSGATCARRRGPLLVRDEVPHRVCVLLPLRGQAPSMQFVTVPAT